MIISEAAHHKNPENLSKHRCEQCLQNEIILEKYKKLVDLLYKKIKQLQKKSKSQLHENQLQKESTISIGQSNILRCSTEQAQNFARYMSDIVSPSKQNKQFLQVRTKQSFRDDAKHKFSASECSMSEIQKLQKVSLVINGLTEQVMQLKSNFMHIRHCVYAFVKELNLAEKIYANPIGFNIALALISIFEFSENQKQEMFNHKKVKLRKKAKNKDKENIFVTVKQI